LQLGLKATVFIPRVNNLITLNHTRSLYEKGFACSYVRARIILTRPKVFRVVILARDTEHPIYFVESAKVKVKLSFNRP
jgi:hypothetical protein